jgi:hypothetical protein
MIRFGKNTIAAAAIATTQMNSVTQPCHVQGGPQPQPYRFAGNQYLDWRVTCTPQNVV